MSETIHHGRNIKRLREMLGIKQEGLAYELGEEWTQKRVSILEQKDVIEQDILDQVAKILKVPADAIKNFDEEKAIFNIQNNYDNANQNVNYQFSPIDKWIEAVDDIKKLYERLLQSEKEKIEILQKLLDRNL